MLNNWNIKFWEYEFLSPQWLWLLLALPLLGYFIWRKDRKRTGDWKFTGTTENQQLLADPRILMFRRAIKLSYLVVLALLIAAMAKPYHWSANDDESEDYKNGIDIILAMDVSVSMLAMDFQPNRLEASKRVAKEFVDGRHGDRIGLVVYAGEAYTACPATLDYSIVKQQIDQISGDFIEGGTAIGTGLGTAVARLRNDSVPSKVIILLTDGSNNAGNIDPVTAAELARSKGIRVYTIGVGTNGEAPTPVITPFGIHYENMQVEIDETTLKKIAEIANGQYFRATDEKSLKKIYREIDKLEKTRMLDHRFQASPPATPSGFLNWAWLIALIGWIVERIYFRFND